MSDVAVKVSGMLCALLVGLASGSGVSASGERFDFILHDGLVTEDVAHISQAFDHAYEDILSKLRLEALPRITVQIWKDETAYQDVMEATFGSRAPGSRGYVTGGRELRLLYHQRLSAQKGAVHELVHVASLNVNPDFGNNPRWLWEGVAQYLAGELDVSRAASRFAKGACPTLETLNSPFDRGGTIYDTGYLLVDFIDKKWGFDKVLELMGNGGDLAALGLTSTEFEGRWCAFVRREYQ